MLTWWDSLTAMRPEGVWLRGVREGPWGWTQWLVEGRCWGEEGHPQDEKEETPELQSAPTSLLAVPAILLSWTPRGAGGVGRSRVLEVQVAVCGAQSRGLWCGCVRGWRYCGPHASLCVCPACPDAGLWRTQLQNAKWTSEPSPRGEAHQQSDLSVRDLTGEGQVGRREPGSVGAPSAEVQEHPGENGRPLCWCYQGRQVRCSQGLQVEPPPPLLLFWAPSPVMCLPSSVNVSVIWN